jgi:lipoprotein-releasing system permease protein
VEDVFEADTIAGKVEKKITNPDVVVNNWKDQNQQLLSGLQSQQISSNMIQSFILISVIIAIASILSVTVVQKYRQIGILKAMGIKDRQASMIFLNQGLILGVCGAILGITIGVGLLKGFSTFVTNEDGEAIFKIVIEPMFVVMSFIITVLSAAFASLLPARASSRLSPIEVIRRG